MPAKVTPNIDRHGRSTMRLNLNVLRRIDRLISEILLTATHVSLYDFDVKNALWSRKHVEGSLFVVKRAGQPRFQFIVMNRKSTENLVEDLLGDFEFEVQCPYIFYRKAREVTGIWFYEGSQCEEVGRLFQRITKAYSKVPAKLKGQETKSEFDELEDVSSLSITEGPIEHPISPASTLDVCDDSTVKSITAAVEDDKPSDPTIAGEPPGASAAISDPFHVVDTVATAVPTAHESATRVSRNILAADAHESLNETSISVANLLKPSFFSSSPPSSGFVTPSLLAPIPTAPPLYPLVTMLHPYGTPLLQPFPPPAPSASLSSSLTPSSSTITRDKVHVALQRLVQNNDFIDMVYREMLRT